MPIPLNTLDIYNQNFDHYVLLHVEKMTPAQKSMLPAKLLGKLFKKEKTFVEYLTFQEKVYLMSVCFSKRVVVVIEDEKAGIGEKEFKQAVKAQEGKKTNGELLDVLKTHSAFVIGDKELMRSLMYINHVYCSEIYNLLKITHPRDRNKRETKYTNIHLAFTKVIQTLVTYEGKKKATLHQFDLNVPKLYALLYFFDGEKLGRDFYTIAFRYSYTSNRGDLGGALRELYTGGYLDRRGTTAKLRYNITAKGIELLRNVLYKLIYNL